jgi:aspartate/glutamate racemase
MKTFTFTVTVSTVISIDADSADEAVDLIMNGCTDVEDLLNCADYQIDLIDEEV